MNEPLQKDYFSHEFFFLLFNRFLKIHYQIDNKLSQQQKYTSLLPYSAFISSREIDTIAIDKADEVYTEANNKRNQAVRPVIIEYSQWQEKLLVKMHANKIKIMNWD
ncbi:hypothetical protein C1646_768208 [Rhizophagus diaphanus]|nr:hypothetical protein C1646_768208 [Rhizophagus diaphanus] [Rhizophagus sp. MUCL 43196]